MNDENLETQTSSTPEQLSHNEALYNAIFEGKNENTSPIPVLPQLSIALGILLFVFSVTYIGASNTFAKKVNPNDLIVEAAVSTNIPQLKKYVNSFDNTSLVAKSAFVWDVRDQKVLFNKNADAKLPLASVTKLMTALIAYELLDPNAKISISKDSIKTEGDSGFSEGEEFTVQDLTDLTLISSSNDGAVALSREAAHTASNRNPEEVFVTAMNLKAKELGLTHTHFENATGLDLNQTEAGAYGSARDVALLMEYIVTNESNALALTNVDLTTISNEAGDYHTVKNTNEVVDDIDGLIASKTGYTQLAGGNLAVAFNAGLNRPIIVVVLGSSQIARFSDTVTLVEKARQFISHSIQ
jgi:D-alanyl-D-alanine carboxypeptidase